MLVKLVCMCCYINPCMWPCLGCSLIEQKTDWLKDSSANIIRGQQEREDSAQLIKRCVLMDAIN